MFTLKFSILALCGGRKSQMLFRASLAEGNQEAKNAEAEER